MPEPFKNAFNESLVIELSEHLAKHSKHFQKTLFLEHALNNLEKLELKQRSTQITQALAESLNIGVEDALQLLTDILHPEENSELTSDTITEQGVRGWIIMPLADYVANIAIESNFNQGMRCLAEMTKRFSAEFAVRHFIVSDQALAFSHLNKFALDQSEHVRRLASEGCRPRLPWGIRLHELVNDPSPIFKVLASLVKDDSEYVRRSVANNLNDIAKDHPEEVIAFCSSIKDNTDRNTERLIKHACRTLIKDGHEGALALFGFNKFEGEINNFAIDKQHVEEGEKLELQVELNATNGSSQKVVLDYVLYYKKANGQLNPKVFKWKELTLKPSEKVLLSKQHHFKSVTTRKHYAGEHRIALQVNGGEVASKSFILGLNT
ncbi:MAG: DNA alkylation repair protein [Alteromonadaceae bacterium]|nr:DNA alkylation repair protein [Alteromonadaceae bacterium]